VCTFQAASEQFDDVTLHVPNDHVQRSTCSDHKAVNLASAERKAQLEFTGIGAGCCVRHYFFCPAAVGNFGLGERQSCIDPLVCNMRKMHPGITGMTFCYNVGCQWEKNFKKCVKYGSPYLCWDFEDFKLVVAVPTWHLEAHIAECFPRYSLHFVQGAAEIDGENMERLWSGLNKSAPSTRAMTTSYRRESLDWLMNHSNWVKLTNIGT
jgi:hypothetical protein